MNARMPDMHTSLRRDSGGGVGSNAIATPRRWSWNRAAVPDNAEHKVNVLRRGSRLPDIRYTTSIFHYPPTSG